MRRRPQPNRRRGLLRAGGIVIVLVVLLVGAMLIVSSLTAPAARAPTVPNTPGPIRPTPGRTATTPHGTPAPTTSRPRPTAGATTKPLRDAFGSTTAGTILADQQPAPQAGRSNRAGPREGSTVWFSGPGDAYQGRRLLLGAPGRGDAVRVARADPYVRPVQSPDGRYLLYVTVATTRTFPGALWSLWKFDALARSREVLTRMTGMGMAPLGWAGGRILFIRATSSDTDLYEISGRSAHFVSILITQPIMSARLSPDGRWVAFAAPASCTYCTLDIFELPDATLWNGPSGLPADNAITWTDNSAAVVVQLGRQFAAIAPDSHDMQRFTAPASAANLWQHQLTARLSGDTLRLHDAMSGVTIAAREATDTH